MYYLDENINKLVRIFDQNKREGYLRLDLNENPGSLPNEFIENVLHKVEGEMISQYPETLEFTLNLANFLKTDKDHICLVNGSAEGIRYIIEAFTSVGGKIVGVTPSYAMFEVYSKMYGRNFVGVDYDKEMTMNVERIIEKVDKDTELLILLNPNNPVGNVYTKDEMSRLIKTAEENQVRVLIDEAYMYFYPNSFIEYALKKENIFVTRTFSKVFSLAGCRLGYVVGWPQGIKVIQKMCTPHNVNMFSMLFANEIICNAGILNELIEKHKEGKEYLIETLKKNNYDIVTGEGNFVFVRSKIDADILVQRMKNEKKILVKSYNGIGKYGKCLRVTTGEKKYMVKFVNALLELENKE